MNLSFDNLSHRYKDNIFDKDFDIQKIDFISEKNEDNNEILCILNDLNKNIELNVKELKIEKENNNYKECQEILNILKKPLIRKM